MSAATTEYENLPPGLLWLADAAMFIDAEQIGKFYDAVVSPANKEGPTTYQVSDQMIEKAAKKLGANAGTKAGGKGTFGLGSLFAFLGIGTANVEVSGEASIEVFGEHATETGTTAVKSETIVLEPIHTPQRQLVQLTVHYLLAIPDRFFYVEDVTDKKSQADDGWWKNGVISRVPRGLAFINLASFEESEERNVPKTKLIPVAAEFTNGTVVTYFDKFRAKPGTSSCPVHPDIHDQDYKQKKKAYWKWFVDNFQIQPSINLIEESVREQKCRIQWIDFRIPISDDGETLHLHIVAGGNYDTITVAYNFIRRGYEFGLRLIGTLKTDPDMNVLAIYER